jgi:uncharacterized protein with FMN-binding domain
MRTWLNRLSVLSNAAIEAEMKAQSGDKDAVAEAITLAEALLRALDQYKAAGRPPIESELPPEFGLH